MEYINKIFFKDSRVMEELPDSSIHLIITSPPYYNVKDYSKDGKQETMHSSKIDGQIGDLEDYQEYINNLLQVWRECERVLKPNGKLVVNAPLMPILKKQLNTHHNRHIYNIAGDIESSIVGNSNLFLMDIFIWKRTNPQKKLMFGSYPYPPNFYAQNIIEFVSIYVKDGKPKKRSNELKQASKLSEKQWTEYTSQIWEIAIPSRGAKGYGVHSALMPDEIVKRCVKLYSFPDDVVLDPFTGSGTTLRIAKKLKRNWVGYEIEKYYKEIINSTIGQNTFEIA